MKPFIVFIVFTMTTLSYAKTTYFIKNGKLHSGGHVYATASVDDNLAYIKIDYKINPKKFIPGFLKEYLSGTHVEKLPKEFLSEEAYLELEKRGHLEIKDAHVYHRGRVHYGRYINCHKILIKAKNEKSEIMAYYHPLIADAGWVSIALTIKKIPLLDSYFLLAQVKQ